MNEIHNQDFLKNGLESESVDFIVTDPPYNVGKDFGNDSDSLMPQEHWNMIWEWLDECHRLLKPDSNMIFTYSQIGMFDMHRLLRDKELFDFVQVLIYNASNISSFKKSGLYTRTYEPVFVLSKGKGRKLNRIPKVSTADVYRCSKPQSNFKADKGYHPTQKPIKLFLKYILENTNEGDLVVDTFAGAGTTNVACKIANRNCHSYELNKDYVDIARKRIEECDLTTDYIYEA